jgi:hypothetical protein
MARYNVKATVAQTHQAEDADGDVITVTDVAVGAIVNVIEWDGVTPFSVKAGLELEEE